MGRVFRFFYQHIRLSWIFIYYTHPIIIEDGDRSEGEGANLREDVLLLRRRRWRRRRRRRSVPPKHHPPQPGCERRGHDPRRRRPMRQVAEGAVPPRDVLQPLCARRLRVVVAVVVDFVVVVVEGCYRRRRCGYEKVREEDTIRASERG